MDLMPAPHTMPDLVAARNFMVDSQVRPNRVNDPRILDAMRLLPRERFLPPARAHLAYADDDVKLGGGRVLLAPMTIARLVGLAAPKPGEHALLIGSGSGYEAALLAACGVWVTALEEDAGLRALAASALAGLPEANAIHLVAGPLAAGWGAAAPYDFILIAGGVPELPADLATQLRGPAGRLVAVLMPDGKMMGQGVLASPSLGGWQAHPAFDCATSCLPGMAPQPGFVF